MTLKHSNYFALVTGSAGLLGQNHCEALAEIGYNLILTDNNKAALKRQHYSLIKKFKNVKIYHLIWMFLRKICKKSLQNY